MALYKKNTIKTGAACAYSMPTQSLNHKNCILVDNPWGKRRFANINDAGQADVNDSIIGLTLDRGLRVA
jgi:hypothetical protein